MTPTGLFRTCLHVGFRCLSRRRWVLMPVLALGVAVGARGELPEGPGKAETEKLCASCHDMAKSVSLRQDRNGWGATVSKMVAFGAEGTPDEFRAVLDYLAKHYPAEELPAVNVNKARAIQLESRFTLKRSEAAAIIRYRKEHGDFKSLEDLRKVPGVDFSKLEAKQEHLAF